MNGILIVPANTVVCTVASVSVTPPFTLFTLILPSESYDLDLSRWSGLSRLMSAPVCTKNSSYLPLLMSVSMRMRSFPGSLQALSRFADPVLGFSSLEVSLPLSF